MTTITLTSVPEQRGEIRTYGGDGRYRLYTIEHLPFDALPSYSDGGPATVTNDGWSMSTSSNCRIFSSPSVNAADDRMHTLRLTTHPVGVPWSLENDVKHPLNGTKYATAADAKRAAYEAGGIGFMVYNRDAAKWGLPTD